jgi:hypothetical protein
MSTFKPGHDPRRNYGGRPRGRIAKLRATLGELSDDGREVAEVLRAIYLDPSATKKERIDAARLWLEYLCGKPEVAVELSADVTAGPRLDATQLLARLPDELVDKVVAELDGDDPPLELESGDEETD